MTEQYQHKARKRFGQNFLHDAGVIDRILRSISAKSGVIIGSIGLIAWLALIWFMFGDVL